VKGYNEMSNNYFIWLEGLYVRIMMFASLFLFSICKQLNET